MKKTLKIITVTALSSVCWVQAASYSLVSTNLSDVSSDVAVVNNAGNAIGVGSGIAAMGYFKTINDPSAVGVNALVSDFEILASNNFDTTAGSGFSVEGFYGISSSIADAESDTAVINGAGKTLFLFFGNNTDLSSSTEIGLMNTGQSVLSSFTGTPPFESTGNLAGSAVVGSIGTLESTTPATVDFFSTPTGTTGQFRLVVVPEPSSVVLFGLGAVALIFRRRK